jgi:hypothetical protein
MTLEEAVREQILAEGPHEVPNPDAYIDEELNYMSHVDLLTRISNALENLNKPRKP